MKSTHPTHDQLRAFALGQLSPGESSLVEQHVETCVDCCGVLSDVPDDGVLALLKRGEALRISDSRDFTLTGVPAARGTIPLALQQHPRYRIIKVLGDGGMGVVYQAEHRVMARMVALKVINRRLLSNPLAVERFRREVKAAARLTHPNIVVAHDAEEAGELHFLVMEYVDGVSLAQYVERKGPLPVATACFFIRQAALGLQHAARQGMVHRDIKPQNLMLTRKGQIKILDFGLARFASEEAALSGLRPTLDGLDSELALTQAGMTVGTPDYMAPEQALDSSQADTRSDIYSLGCTFYFLLTGRPPFSSNSITSTLRSHAAHQPAALRSLRDDVPPQLIEIIERMMAKDAAERIQSPAEIAKLLTTLSTGGLAAANSADIGAAMSAAPALAATMQEGSPKRAELKSTVLEIQPSRWQTARQMTKWLQNRRYQVTAMLSLAILICLIAYWIPNREPATILKPQVAVVRAYVPVEQRRPRVALVLTRESFWSPDYLYLRDALERQGTEVTVVSSRVGPVTSDARIHPDQKSEEVQATVALGDVRPGDVDGIVFIPSSNSEFMHDSQATPDENQAAQDRYSRLIRELVAADVCLAALGNGVNLLARYGVLDGQEATGPEWVAQNAEYAAVNWDTARGVVASGPDGQFITAWNIRSIREFAERVHTSSASRSQRRQQAPKNP